MNETIRYSVDAEGVALLVLDVPGRPMNVLTPDLLAALEACVDRVARDAGVRGAVVTSAKSGFVAGADLTELVNVFDARLGREELSRHTRSFSKAFRHLETCGKPFVAAINGTALGGGLELCLACHHRVALDDPKAKLGLPEVRVGLLPGAGGTQRLPRLIGIEKALPRIAEGTHFPPSHALELGVADELAADASELLAKSRQWILAGGEGVQPWDRKGYKLPGGAGASRPALAQTFMFGTALAAQKTGRNYPAPVAVLSCVYEGSLLPIDAALELEGQYFMELLTGPVARNMIRTLFIDKGAAENLARRPKGIEKRPVVQLGVLGAGRMGAGIAHVAALAGIDVVLLDTSLEAAQQGRARSRSLLDAQVGRCRLRSEAADAVLERIRPTMTWSDLAGCELVIEAVFEDCAVKADVTRRAEAVLGPEAIFASNTSALPIGGLAEASSRPERFVGMHFFSPVERMPLVEVIMGARTGDEALAQALDFVRQIGKTPIVVNDSRGFYTSRVFGAYVKEGLAMLAEGVAPALIENAAQMAGLPVGPLAVSDELGIDLQDRILEETRRGLGSAYRQHPADEVIRRFHDGLQRHGKRAGAGFYEYPDGGRKRLWPGLAAEFPRAAEQPAVEAVQERLLYIQSLETARCMEEGVLTDPADADLGSILGWGFPAWSGGTLSLIDTTGTTRFLAACDALATLHGERFRPPEWLKDRDRIR